jgi:transcriptional regulator with XRE-family HTH domain
METKSEPKAPKRRNPRHYMREWRQERDMTQLALAKAIGSTKSLISRYEAGTVGMSLDLIFKSIEALNIGLKEFFEPPKRAKRTPARLRKIQRLHRRMKAEPVDK